MSQKLQTCQVCDIQGDHGYHFGVVSCRACSAFFRRTAISKWTNAECQNGKCDQIKYFCKPCRLKRCLDAGMKTSNFQYNRDALHNSLNFKDLMISPKLGSKIPPSLANFVGRPEMVLFCDSEKPVRKTRIDVGYLIDEASNIFRKPVRVNCKTEGPLYSLAVGMGGVRNLEYKKISSISQAEVSEIWQFYFLLVAKWLMHFEEFQKLDGELKMSILQSAWHIWATLDRHCATANYRTENPSASKAMLVSRRGLIADSSKVKYDASWLSDYSLGQISFFTRQSSPDNFDIIGALQELQPTDVEMTFMLAQLSFEYAGKRCQGEVLKITENFQTIIADDLHNYYINDLNTPKYFDRVAKLMKVNNAIQKTLWEHRPRMEMAKVFNIIKTEFSHPEMFKDSGFN